MNKEMMEAKVVERVALDKQAKALAKQVKDIDTELKAHINHYYTHEKCDHHFEKDGVHYHVYYYKKGFKEKEEINTEALEKFLEIHGSSLVEFTTVTKVKEADSYGVKDKAISK